MMFARDLQYGLHSLLRRPGFTVFIILVLALGIGPTTAIFSIANGVLLRPLPYQDGDRLVSMVPMHGELRMSNSYPDFVSYGEQSELFEKWAVATQDQELNLTGGDEPERVAANLVSPSFFELLGAKAHLGRLFLPEENQIPGGHPVVVFSHRLWRNRFAADPEVIGKVVQLHGNDYTVVGVLTPDFVDFISDQIDVYVPMMMAPVIHRPGYIEDRRLGWLEVFGRIRPGVTIAQARAEMETIWSRLVAEFPATNEGYQIHVMPLREYRHDFPELHRAILVLVLGAAFILLIICVNVANLMILRAFEREQEMALRMTLGGARWRLIRQLLCEGLLLSLVGGALGVLLAAFLTNAFAGFIEQAYFMPPVADVAVDFGTLGVIGLIVLVSGLVFGLAPALMIRQLDLWKSLQMPGRSSFRGGSNKSRSFLTVAEVALAMTLLIGAALAAKSFNKLTQTKLGFLTPDTLTARFELPPARYSDPEKSYSFYRRVVERAQAIPGCEFAGIWGPGIPGNDTYVRPFTPEGRPRESGSEQVMTFEHRITPGLLRHIGIPLLEGREFRPDDNSENRPVALVSETLAQVTWPDQEPIGRRFWLPAPYEYWVEVVGLVGDVRHRGRTNYANDRFEDVFFPLAQMKARRSMILIRATGSRSELERRIKEVVRSVDPEIPLFNLQTMAERLAAEEVGTRFHASLMAAYAFLALLLAVMGIYSVLAYSVRQRTQEIGIRMALGARASHVIQDVVGRAMVLVAIGLGLGLAGGFALTGAFSGLLFGVEATDPTVFVGITLLFAAIAVTASMVPAWQAARLDPATTTRYE